MAPKPHPQKTIYPREPSADRRQRRGAETRERLFRAALDLFARRGLDNTTVKDITEAADVGKGTFFNYFPTKEHILLAFADMQVGKLQTLVEEVRNVNQPMPVFLHQLTVRMTAEPGRNPSVIRALLSAYLAAEPVRHALREHHLRGERLLAEWMAIGQERGEIRKDFSAIQLAQVFRQTVFGTLLLWSVHGETPLAERIQAALDVLWSGLSARNLAHSGNMQEAGTAGATGESV